MTKSHSGLRVAFVMRWNLRLFLPGHVVSTLRKDVTRVLFSDSSDGGFIGKVSGDDLDGVFLFEVDLELEDLIAF